MKDQIHDCLVDILGEKPDDLLVDVYHDKLPDEIRLLAEMWGENDTEVREKTYRWIKGSMREGGVFLTV